MSDRHAFNEMSSAIPKHGSLRMVSNETSRGRFWTGDFFHRAGLVTILREGPTAGFPKGYTRLDAVIKGRLVYRSWRRFWSDRALPRLARDLLGVE
jgi:hypothetical protein